MIAARRCPPFSWARLLGPGLPAAPARAERCTIKGAVTNCNGGNVPDGNDILISGKDARIQINRSAMSIAAGQPDTRVSPGRPV